MSKLLIASIIVIYVFNFKGHEVKIPYNKEAKYAIAEAYDYPILPGTDAWKGLRSNQEKFEATDVPLWIAENMTTEALIETVLTWPMFPFAAAYNDPSIVLEIQMEFAPFAPLKELLKREDAPAVVLEAYRAFDTAALYDDLPNYVMLNNIEMLLGYRPFWSKFSDSQMEELIEIVFEKVEEKQFHEYSEWAGVSFFRSLDMTVDEAPEAFKPIIQSFYNMMHNISGSDDDSDEIIFFKTNDHDKD